jgi:hypothetical protein
VVMAYYKVLTRYSFGVTDENLERPLSAKPMSRPTCDSNLVSLHQSGVF